MREKAREQRVEDVRDRRRGEKSNGRMKTADIRQEIPDNRLQTANDI
jgi:hypothetical protein